jgi:hypothetical protein
MRCFSRNDTIYFSVPDKGQTFSGSLSECHILLLQISLLRSLDHAGRGIRADGYCEVFAHFLSCSAGTAAQIDDQPPRAFVVGEDGIVETCWVGGTEIGIRGGAESLLSAISQFSTCVIVL